MDNIVKPIDLSVSMERDFLRGAKGDKGDTGEQGVQGPAGYSPVKGVDYFTEEDIKEITDNVLNRTNVFDALIVDDLPVDNINDKAIYFVLKLDSEDKTVYDEYMFIDGEWRNIGSTDVDFSKYYVKDEVDGKFDVLKGEIADGYVNRSGDVMSGSLEIVSDDLYGFKKSRTIDGIKYTASLNVGSDGSARVILDEGTNRVAQLVIKKDGTMFNTDKKLLTADSIETVTNNNGTAIKFPDGTMICSKDVIFEKIACATESGAIFITDQLSLGNFAVEFTNIPVMTVSKVRHDAGWIYNTNQISKISAGYVTFASATSRSSATFECHLIAIGRWK